MKALSSGVRVPDGIMAAYPATLLTTDASPSRLLTLIDPFLPLGVLTKCLNAYAGNMIVDLTLVWLDHTWTWSNCCSMYRDRLGDGASCNEESLRELDRERHGCAARRSHPKCLQLDPVLPGPHACGGRGPATGINSEEENGP